MLEFKVDPAKKTMSITVMLKGESEPLSLNVKEYSLKRNEDGSGSIVVNSVVSSREWINTLLQELVIGKKFDLPAEAMKGLSLLA